MLKKDNNSMCSHVPVLAAFSVINRWPVLITENEDMARLRKLYLSAIGIFVTSISCQKVQARKNTSISISKLYDQTAKEEISTSRSRQFVLFCS
jgi:hypothetical protein